MSKILLPDFKFDVPMENDKAGLALIKMMSKMSSAQAEKIKIMRMLELFHETARAIPAYRDFLRKHGIKNHNQISTKRDFLDVPVVDKKNYLKEYGLENVIWPKMKNSQITFTATSGSTGQPFYFPRAYQLDWQSSAIHEWFLNHRNDKGNTLVIVGFGMGVWIGGLITYRAFEISGYRNDRKFSIITPGVNKIEIMNAIKNIAPLYKNIIFAGYPPFVKDICDESAREGIDWSKWNTRIVCAAESFSESFRDYLVKGFKLKSPYLDIMNIYGSADIGTMAFETPFSIYVRREAGRDRKLFKNIFGDIKKTPTLAQYHPWCIGFEAINGELILTGNSVVPLVRYSIGDHGGVFSHDELIGRIDIKEKEVSKNIIELPYVYVYERNDFSTTLYGLQIYPEMIRESLIHPEIQKYATGRFVMSTKVSRRQDQFLQLELEMKKGIKEKDIDMAKHEAVLISKLRHTNSEFRELHDYLKGRKLIKCNFWEHEHPTYFSRAGKQKWVKSV